MLSGTWNRYHETFAAPHNLFRASAEKQPESSQEIGDREENMLLIQPRKRTSAIFEQSITQQHQTSEPQQQEKILPHGTQEVLTRSHAANTRDDYNVLFRNEISAMSLEQLQELSILVSNRIEIKRRYNNTPLRRIIARQELNGFSRTTSRPESDTVSQTDTLVNNEPHETVKESPGTIQARYNNTPLRRILSQQNHVDRGRLDVPSPLFTDISYEVESPESRRARYSNTPLRRIISRQSSGEQHNEHESTINRDPTTTPTSAPNSTLTPIPRSNTPLRRILSRQVSPQTITTKDEDELSERADSVISPFSPIRSRSTQATATIHLNSEATIRAYEEQLWRKSTTSLAEKSQEQLQEQEKQRLAAVQITLTELAADVNRSKRVIVDSKGSPLKRILQRQNSKDWKAPARVAVV